MAFAGLTASLQLNISDFSSKLTSASRQLSAFAGSLQSNYKTANATLSKHNLGLKDTARIVQGIMISQAFYTGARAISNATSALWEFNEALDYAQVTYTALFGSSDIASDFMQVLQEHSINTIFGFDRLAQASKKLLAYGIDYKNLMFIMEGLTNLGAMSGDEAALDRISYALGQIYAKGKLTAEEMRQLANAYVPIQDIIKEEFNLSPEDLGNVSDLNLPAYKVINAIVDYANEKFGSVGDAAMLTITGLHNRIVDTLKVVGTSMLKPITTVYKSLLVYISNGLDGIREAFAAGGVGGVFEYLVPNKKTQDAIRLFLANLHNLFMSLLSVMKVLGQVAGNFGKVLITAFNMIIPVVVPVINSFAALVHSFLETSTGAAVLRVALVGAAGAFVLFKAHAIGALVVTTLTKAITGLSKALLILSSIITKHPILMLIAGLTIALVGLAVSSDKANGGLSKLFNLLTGASGKSQEDVLNKVEQNLNNSSDAADQFNDRLEGGADAAEDLANGINKAGKATKSILSFDEVFKLPETASAAGAGSDITDSVGDLISGLSGLGDALIPEIPDFNDFIDDFTDGLFGGLKDSWIAKAGAAGLGALLVKNIFDNAIKALAGAEGMAAATKFLKTFKTVLISALVGVAFDAVASVLTDKLWAYLEDAIKLKDGSAENAQLGSTIGSVIGSVIGSIIGGPGGMLIGSAIGHLAGGIVGLFWESVEGAFQNTALFGTAGIASAIAKAFGGTLDDFLKQLPGLVKADSIKGVFKNIGALFTGAGLKEVAKGGLIGMAVGFVVDAIAGVLFDWLAEALNLEAEASGRAKIAGTIGSIIGSIIGGIFGGPAGALIGSAIGTFVGGIYELLVEKMHGILTNFWTDVAKKYDIKTDDASTASVAQMIVQGLVTALTGGNIVAGAGAGILAAIGTLLWDETYPMLEEWWNDTWAGFSGWATNTWNSLTGWATDTWTSLSTWWNDTKQGFSDWWDNTVSIFSDWDNITGETLGNWWNDTKQGFSDWWNNTTSGFSTWFEDTFSGLSNWWNNTKQGLSGWWEDTKAGFDEWYNTVGYKVKLMLDESLKGITDWVGNTINKIATWVSDTKAKITNWASDVGNRVGTWARDTWNKFQQWKEDVLAVIGGFAIAALKAIGKWCTDTFNSIKEWFSKLPGNIKTWWDNIWKPETWKSGWSHVSGWFSNLLSSISNWFSSLAKSVSNWWDSLWDDKEASVSYKATGASPVIGRQSSIFEGHATGGIFNREHIARFAEGNRAEAVIPLENAGAMQPFVNAVSNGLLESLAPMLLQAAPAGAANSLPPMYVGTLIADERGLKQLYKKFEIIQQQENARRGNDR